MDTDGLSVYCINFLTFSPPGSEPQTKNVTDYFQLIKLPVAFEALLRVSVRDYLNERKVSQV